MKKKHCSLGKAPKVGEAGVVVTLDPKPLCYAGTGSNHWLSYKKQKQNDYKQLSVLIEIGFLQRTADLGLRKQQVNSAS